MKDRDFVENLSSDPVFWKWLVFRGKLPAGLDEARNEACSQAWLEEVMGKDVLEIGLDDPAAEEKFNFMVKEPFLRWRDRR